MSEGRFPELPASVDALEQEVAARWEREDTFSRSLERTANGEPFVFWEGPPTANGRPGIHHVMSRTLKDSVARFRTMRGRSVTRMAGWDTHGLPVEIEAEKRLGISGKPEIETLGISRFNEICRESVLTYTDEWERFSSRIGYWLDYSRPYVTYRPEYIESVWNLFQRIAERGLVYRGHKILPYCPRCGTGLSSHEVSLGYRDVDDPSLHFIVQVEGEDGPSRELLVWTTTPWTVPANTALAVDPGLEYAEVERAGRCYVLASARVEALFGDDVEVARRFSGSELVGLRYRRPFDWIPASEDLSGTAWRVLPADFVSAEDGTGIVHMAPAYGADDYEMAREHDLPVFRPVDDGGRFREDLPVVGGRFVKDADDDLVEDLRRRDRVFRAGRETHAYPHCWRCQSPLLYMARDSWFIRTTEVRDRLLADNRAVHWHPPEIGTGRMGEWLENNVDWAISRDRYWGTPLPIWVSDRDPEQVQIIGSLRELGERAGGLPEDFDPHRPFIDEVTWPDGAGGTMRRVAGVMDVWFDSGSMPYAQWHAPFENRERMERHFPADFISEGVDQTRGWFYSLLAISTLLERGPAYRNVIVNGLILDAEGRKMSKSRGNVVEPWEAIAEHGADAIRWYLLSGSNPWLPKRFDPEGVREVQRKVFDTVRNVYRFFALYANLEGWAPDPHATAGGGGSVMDRWLRSRTSAVAARTVADMEAYDLTHAVRAVAEFVDDLSNWYVRRSRDRFWGGQDAADAGAAFGALHAALVATARFMAPFAPFFADWLHRALLEGQSAHLADFPAPPLEEHDEALEQGMDIVRRLATLGRAAREQAGIRVRQPLGSLHVVLPDSAAVPHTELLDLLRRELNVKTVDLSAKADRLVTLSAKPNFRALGARFESRTPSVAGAVRAVPSEVLAEAGEAVSVTVDGEEIVLREGDYEIVQQARGDLVVERAGGLTVALDPSITSELRAEGLAREVVNRVQRLRRDSGLAVDDRIRLSIAGGAEIREALAAYRSFVAGETLAVEFELPGDTLPEGAFAVAREVTLDGRDAVIALVRMEPFAAASGEIES